MKRTKLFLTGMAALALSFGLLFSGCDSGGDDDDGGGTKYITIAETTAGTDAGTKAVFTVTVENPLPAGKYAEFTNVATVSSADSPVFYGPPASAANTAALQAAAIAAVFGVGGTAPNGALYTAVYTSGASFTLTQKTAAAIANKTAWPTVAIHDVPADITGTLTATEAANDGKNIKLVVAGGTFAGGAKVYYKKDGTEILITATPADAPTADYTTARNFSPSGADKLISDAGVPVKATGLTAGDLKEGTVALTLKPSAFSGSVTGITAGFGVKTVLPTSAATLTLKASATGANDLVFNGTATPPTLQIGNSGSPAPLDPDFDGALIAVLTNLAPNDTVSTDANGAIDSATFNAAPTAAKITGAFGGTNALILGVTWGIPGNGTVTIPVNKVFTVNAVDLTTVGAATIKVDGTLVVDKDGTDKVTIADAVITAGGAETLGDDTSGAVTLAANGSGIALGANGSVTTVGTATLVVGVTATGKVTINDAAITATAAAPAFASVASGVGTVNIGNTSIVLAATVPGAFTTAAAGIISAGGDTDKTVLVKAGITALSAGDTITATGDGVITVPASTIDLAAGGTATIAGNGALLVGGSSGTVRLEKAVYTATAASATFANVTSSVGSITIDATNILALGVGGKIAITGTSSVKGGTGFIIKGAGEWAVSGAGVTITLGAGGTTATIVGASASAILTPSSGTAEIAIQAAATSTGISIGPGMVDLSTNGKITIAQYGVLSLLANGVIKGGGTDANPLTSSNKAIVNAAAVGSDLVLKAATDTTSQVIGTITGAASNNTITPTGATAVTLDKTTTNT